MTEITESNWNYYQYQLGPLRVFISCGGELASPTSNGDPFSSPSIEFYYYVTVTSDKEKLHKMVSQETFSTCLEAVNFINQKYKSWKLIETPGVHANDSCSTCGS